MENKMITTEILTDLGFKKIHDIFTGKEIWSLGEQQIEICGNTYNDGIIFYKIETQSCLVVKSEYCILNRECKSEEDIIKFVDCINFLFNLSIDINKHQLNETLVEFNNNYSKDFKFTVKSKDGKILLQQIVTFGTKEYPFPDNWKEDYFAQNSVMKYKQKFIDDNFDIDISENTNFDI